ncbi:MAG: dTMP kinase [Thermoanaerobaculia bacterium]
MPAREKKNNPGLFITFEGIEGSGKSSQLRRAAELLTERGIPVLATREPGGTPLGTQVRALLLDFSGRVDPGAELLLMFADRRQHLVEEIEPALARGIVVLCDRYTDASRAYQGAGRRLGVDTVDDLHRRFCGREPDRTYLFDCPVPVALARIAKRGSGARDRIERENIAFHRRVRAAYRLRAATEPKRFRVLDGTRAEEQVFEDLALDLTRLIARHAKGRAR